MGHGLFRLVGAVEGRPVEHLLAEGHCLIGRSPDCDLRLPLEAISRHHAQLTVTTGGIFLRDMGSRNGTLVNGRRAEGEVRLEGGDEIAVAGVTLSLLPVAPMGTVLFAAPQAVLASQELTWEESHSPLPEGAERLSQLFPVLAEAGELLSRTVEPEDLFEPILDLVERVLQPDRIFLLLVEPGVKEPLVRASRLRDGRQAEGIVLSRTLLDRVLGQKSSFLTADALNDPLLRAQESIVSLGIRSAMAVPMFDNRHVIGVLYADSSKPLRSYSRDELRCLTLLANVVAVAITNARHRVVEQERQRLEAELETARRLLARILPAEAPPCPGWDLAFRLDSCLEVAGDLYDVRRLADGRLLVLVGDVSGKGLGAALMVVQILSLVRLLADDATTPGPLVERVNEQLWQTTDTERFVTLFLGILEPETGRLVYVNGGHEPPEVLDPAGKLRELASTGPLVGAFPGLPYKVAETVLAPGELLLLYTDGLTEALDGEGTEFGRERLADSLRGRTGTAVGQLLAGLAGELAAFRGATPVGDDVTLLALKRQPQAPGQSAST